MRKFPRPTRSNRAQPSRHRVSKERRGKGRDISYWATRSDPEDRPKSSPRCDDAFMLCLITRVFSPAEGTLFILYPGIHPLDLFNSPQIPSPPFRSSEIPSIFFVECVASQVLAQQPPGCPFFEPPPPPPSSCEWFLLADVATPNVIWFDCFVQFTFLARFLLVPSSAPPRDLRDKTLAAPPAIRGLPSLFICQLNFHTNSFTSVS